MESAIQIPFLVDSSWSGRQGVKEFIRAMELQEARCHGIWAMLLFIDIFLLPLPLSYLPLQNWGFAYFLSGVLTLPIILLVSLSYRRFVSGSDFLVKNDFVEERYRQRVDQGLELEEESIVETDRAIKRLARKMEEEARSWWENAAWRYKFWILLRQCVRLEFFGWIVFFCGSLGAINSAIEPIVTSIKKGELATGVYFALMDKAAYELTRAAIIGIIVLFFAQILRQHRDVIDKTSKAAGQASEAAKMAGRAAVSSSQAVATAETSVTRMILQAEAAIPKMEGAIRNGMSYVKYVSGDFHRFQLLEQLGRTGALLPAGMKELFDGIIDQLGKSLDGVLKELHSPEGDDFESACFYSLYLAYMTSESLTFAGKDYSGNQIELGQGSCEFATRFVNYSIAVRKIVEALESIERQRFEYHTIFVGKPSRFFNIENRGADPQWSIDFLNFCRIHETQDISYQRYFVSSKKHDGEAERLYNVDDIEDDLNTLLVCLKEGGDPVLWSSSPELLSDTRHYESLARIASHFRVEDPGFILRHYERGAGTAGDIPELPKSYTWRPLREVLPTYFNPRLEPQLFKFFALDKYHAVFGHHKDGTTVLPRDVFAVWDKRYGESGGWRLCMGAMSPSEYDAVRLNFATTKRHRMRRGSWQEMSDKLTLLFKGMDQTHYFEKAPLKLRQ